jgi:hypothetical protein
METVIIIIAVGAMCIASFFVGAHVGNKVSKDEPIELPKADPMKVIRQKNERAAAKAKQAEVDAVLRNINRYNGTAEGQEDIPRR